MNENDNGNVPALVELARAASRTATGRPADQVPTSGRYRRQAVKFLRNHFPAIACMTISSVFADHAYSFTPTFQALARIQDQDEDALQQIRAAQPDSFKIFIKTERKKTRVRITHPDIMDEMGSIPALSGKKTADDDDGDGGVEGKEDDIDDNVSDITDCGSFGSAKDAEDDSDLHVSECGCCFGDYPPEAMDECSAHLGHRCCRDCIKRYAVEQLDGKNSTEFSCIVERGCTGTYTQHLLSQILSPKTNQRLTDRFIRADIEASGMNAWTCSECNNIGVLGDEPLPDTVHCEVCDKVYCRLCKHHFHQGQTCEERDAEIQRLKDPILRAQEAMTEATMRKCPQCATPFEKTDGCNKMVCSSCGCRSCYLCNEEIEGYAHFCTIQFDCTCHQCHLWRKSDEADKRARLEAGRKSLANDGFSEEEIERALASMSVGVPTVADAEAESALPDDADNQPEPMDID